MLTGAYVPGRSVVHRAPAGAKLAVLAVACTALVFARTPLWVGVAGAVVVALYVLARVGRRAAWGQLRPLRWLVVVLMVIQVLVADLPTAVTLTARLVLAVALAALVTLTTRTTDLMAALERGLRPFRRLGVDPARVSLLMSLALRSVPVVAGIAGRIREARWARGRERSVRAFAVPLVVGVLRHADAMGEALQARGLDD
ncbi:energy-coupling factor transporter transmembrane protein EcfT [Jiangella ureilytica]|uniref:Energy-coupling factor transporter transmembrane protein EcfT n=1 Tax=Jiangella ureilytica TaxID=2530374 RepID=A0A4R4RHF5_9ACTN|nr:energy-coupling factor transporter transmembrane protein EcfT [Jiangella ureilytica]TDC48269.1 energy-coupling factor transporter transmembrane protein EcfT [Jiangella ureilytica]